MNYYKYKIIAQFFKALSHPTRLMIVNELLNKKRCVNDIEEILELKQPNISQHLNLLRLLNIVDFKQDGNKKCYFLSNPELIRDLFRFAKDIKITAETANDSKMKKTLK